MYALQKVHLTQAMQKKIKAFQSQGLRMILNFSSTFVNRATANDCVIREAKPRESGIVQDILPNESASALKPLLPRAHNLLLVCWAEVCVFDSQLAFRKESDSQLLRICHTIVARFSSIISALYHRWHWSPEPNPLSLSPKP